jgi:hypothetical protein
MFRFGGIFLSIARFVLLDVREFKTKGIIRLFVDGPPHEIVLDGEDAKEAWEHLTEPITPVMSGMPSVGMEGRVM